MSDSQLFQDCWFLSGPTASGKTQVGIELAQRIDAEIVAVDSMSLYRDMDIATAKPTPEEQAVVPHHLIDVFDPCEKSSISQYLELAERAVREIQNRGKRVLFVGGTPLYLKALLRGLTEGPPPDEAFREQLEQEVKGAFGRALHERLKMVDPLSASRIHEHDTRRMIRALEVYHTTGKPMSHYQFDYDDPPAAEHGKAFWLSWPRDILHQRINRRVDAMFVAGLIEEVEKLRAKYDSFSTTALQGVGYREVIDLLDGQIDEPTVCERIKARTRQFAKRQCTWFRSLPECREVPLSGEFNAATIAEELIALADANDR